jgi:glycerol-3-phosphate responsive antiterminator
MTKKVNADKWKALQNEPQLAQIKQASQMGMEINYTTTIVLPRPVKKIDNPLAILSDDKKTVVMKFNLINAFDHPEQFGYTIQY